VRQIKRRLIELTGIVQGVGFRPAVYRLAREHSLVGFVRNDGRGVTIEVEGDSAEVAHFSETLLDRLPSRASVKTVKTRDLEPKGYRAFSIETSSEKEEKTSLVSPDIACCEDCLSELIDNEDRRYNYPFINCTNCGPRFTIVRNIPYDRKNTTMSQFPMCADCRAEYENPEDRRFHAQPNACHVCGPRVTLEDSAGLELARGEDAVHSVLGFLEQGKVIAVKGLGGFHLACDASNSGAVRELRQRKYREEKPFAVMALDVEAVSRHCQVNECEKRLLLSPERPIVLLRRLGDSTVAEDVAPGQKYLGFMLPYTPLHHLILRESEHVLVMTSGNISDEPISYKDDEAKKRLAKIADFFLLNNREINTRCDDSVTREFAGTEYVVRRGRGYSPNPLSLSGSFEEHILGCGAELKNTFTVARDRHAFVSHHIGDLKNIETLSSYRAGVEHYCRLFTVKPEVVAHDLHPDYLSTRFALDWPVSRKIGVQHHHAHVASVMLENGIRDKVLGVALDGAGYGEDGKVWGCEFLLADYHEYERRGHLDYIQMPGGDRAVKEPYRMAFSWLFRAYGERVLDLKLDLLRRHDRAKLKMLSQAIERGLNSPPASSAGRLFDAVSSMVSLRDTISYEGQAAVDLEMVADESCTGSYPYEVREENGMLVIDPVPLVRKVVEDCLKGVSVGHISGAFHNTMAAIVLDMCRRLKDATGLADVALSGGVFQNMLLLSKTVSLLKKASFHVYIHHQVPTNDACISLGQVAVANSRL
jgi:hydrogenase maturation protein HypF